MLSIGYHANLAWVSTIQKERLSWLRMLVIGKGDDNGEMKV